MTNTYRWVQWNRHKRVYDATLAACCVFFLAVFAAVTIATNRPPADISPPIIAMRALAALAIVLLHVILAIGPLARLTTLAAPLLYNRRHLGVTMFIAASLHALIALGFYGAFGVQSPLAALYTDRPAAAHLTALPFEFIGAAALAILFLLAATSHDFWLANLSPRTWKNLHMLVYPAYALVLLHVAFGAMLSEPSTLYPVAMLAGATIVGLLHIAAALKERARERAQTHAVSPSHTDSTNDTWLDVAAVDDVPQDRAAIVCPKGAERIAIFRRNNTVAAFSNLCPHQGGPIGEGHIVDGCITCPWHGYQFRPEDGKSPPPYTEKLPTYHIRIEGKRILLNPTPAPADAPATPTPIPDAQQ